MFIPESYKEIESQLLNLHVKITFGQHAPHKPILVLSIIDLIESGYVNSRYIPYDCGVERQFLRNWTRYICFNDAFNPRFSVAFWHLDHEPFWNLQFKDGVDYDIKDLNDRRVYNSMSQMSKYVDGAMLSEELFSILQDSLTRAKLRVAIIKRYL